MHQVPVLLAGGVLPSTTNWMETTSKPPTAPIWTTSTLLTGSEIRGRIHKDVSPAGHPAIAVDEGLEPSPTIAKSVSRAIGNFFRKLRMILVATFCTPPGATRVIPALWVSLG